MQCSAIPHTTCVSPTSSDEVKPSIGNLQKLREKCPQTTSSHFLQLTLGNAAKMSREGAVHFACMDWRHVADLMKAAKPVYGAHLNTAVWVKSNAGQGSFYRSQHEFILVYRVGSSKHLNNVELGKHGRSRSNVWNYPGVNTFKTGDVSMI